MSKSSKRSKQSQRKKLKKTGTMRDWHAFLNELTVATPTGKLSAVVAGELDEFEKKKGTKLPASYRSFCRVFGAGDLGRQFRIAVPGYRGPVDDYSLNHLNKLIHDEIDCEDDVSEPLLSAVFFATDEMVSAHFFYPHEVTDTRRHEYCIYTLRQSFEVEPIADSFWEFITNYCMGSKYDVLIDTAEPPERVFSSCVLSIPRKKVSIGEFPERIRYMESLAKRCYCVGGDLRGIFFSNRAQDLEQFLTRLSDRQRRELLDVYQEILVRKDHQWVMDWVCETKATYTATPQQDQAVYLLAFLDRLKQGGLCDELGPKLLDWMKIGKKEPLYNWSWGIE